MNPLSHIRTTALAGVACSILTIASCACLCADELTAVSEETSTYTLHIIEENREFSFPPGYMDRSPKRHRVAVKEFCTNGILNLTDEGFFRDRAAVVHKFNLSTYDAIELDNDFSHPKKTKHTTTPVKKHTSEERVKKEGLRFRAL